MNDLSKKRDVKEKKGKYDLDRVRRLTAVQILKLEGFQSVKRNDGLYSLGWLQGVTEEEIIIIKGLCDAAKEACEVEFFIREAYKNFENSHEIVNSFPNGHRCHNEKLYFQGIWRIEYPNHGFGVLAEKEDIFKLFRAEFLVQNQYVTEGMPEAEMARNCKVFRVFLRKTKKKLRD